MDDKSIIELFWRRDEAAISETKQKYGKSMEGLAYRLIKNVQDTEECCSDTYFELWKKIPPDHPVHFKAFILRILRCNAINRIEWKNAQKRRCILVELTREMEESIPDYRLAGSCSPEKLSSCLNGYLRSLSPEKRAVFIRRYWYGDSIQELSRRFGLSRSNVKTSLYRMRNALKEYLAKEGLYYEDL